MPDSPKVGLVFYPGAFVDYRCYASLAAGLVQKGFLCILPKPLFNVALLNKNIAVKLKRKHPDIDKWYIGGHSFGGSVAAMCLGDNPDEFQGLVMLASYALNDLSTSGKIVVCIYGTEDGVLDRRKYNECLKNLPSDYQEFVINGGNHCFFGEYGNQNGDGIATITRAEQISQTIEAISKSIAN
ncbi:MAG: alpha/beta hydrolase [Bacteroidaceae bacterium]|nr:alpha/beta hydrolase [Bacteroidaceae bacterium]